MRQLCQGTNQAGQPCGSYALASDFCFAHDPAYKERRLAGAVKGGHNKSYAARARAAIPDELREVKDLLMEAIRKSARGALYAGRAAELSTLARAIVAVHEAGVGAVERADLQAEVEALKRSVQEGAR